MPGPPTSGNKWERLQVALGSLLFTYLFFFEYLRPFRRVHIPFDLEEYYYPLADYAYQALRHGRFPLWDPSTYSGMSFVANVQAQLFYPPAWVLFALRAGSERLSYAALEQFVIAHVWVAFLLCYCWLRGKRLKPLASILGAATMAYGGYMCEMLQHLGWLTGFAWMPLGLWGIDQAVERDSWRPLWKLALAMALCFLAGYPSTWFVYLVVIAVYAGTKLAFMKPGRVKVAMGVAAAGLLSLGLIAAQLLPTIEATGFREPESRYDGAQEIVQLVALGVPSYINFAMGAEAPKNDFAMYLYLGAPGLLAIVLLIWLWIRRRELPEQLPLLAVGAACVVIITNPFDLVGMFVHRSSLLGDICRGQSFLAGVSLAFAGLTGVALDDFLKRESRSDAQVGRTFGLISLVAMVAWAAFDLYRWFGPGFTIGWAGLFDPLVALGLFAVGLRVVRSQTGAHRRWSCAVVLLLVGVDYKVFGTGKRFDATPGLGQEYFSNSFMSMDPAAFQEMRAHPQARVLVDQTGPLPVRLRHVGLLTPQGFDPFMSIEYRKLVESMGTFQDDREFAIDPDNDAALRLLGVRYIVSADVGAMHPKLAGNPKFRLIGDGRPQFFYQVFEYLQAEPTYKWTGAEGAAELRAWAPEERSFVVKSTAGGQLALSEQFYPGWSVSVDGKDAPIEHYSGAFQQVAVPPGEHSVVFRFRSVWLGTGIGLSLFALGLLAGWIYLDLKEGGTRSRAEVPPRL